jgi:methionyl-tRNA synthetase
MKFMAAKYELTVPSYTTTGPEEQKLITAVNTALTSYMDSLETCKSIRAGLRTVMEISSLGNGYLQENKIDNSLFLNRRDRCNTVVALSLNLCYLLSALAYPYVPGTAESMARQLNLPLRRITESWDAEDILEGHVLRGAEYLFTRIDEKRAQELRDKYSGGQKGDKKEKKADKKKKGGSSAGAPVLLSEAPATVVKNDVVVALEAEIKAAGEEVRRLKAEKAAADVLKTALGVLIEKKEALTKEVAVLLEGLSISNK